MTTETFSPYGVKHTLPTAPPVTQTVPDVNGGSGGVVHDVLRAGLDPIGSFAAGAALHRVTDTDRMRNWANTTLGRQSVPQSSLAGNVISPANSKATVAIHKPPLKPVASTGRATAQHAARSLGRTFLNSGAKTAVKSTGLLAAKRGAAIGGKVAAMSALRLGAMSIPGIGTAITVALWCIDTDERRAVNNMISSLVGPGGAPELDAPPEPPRTQFLPLTHDGNRDGIIDHMDAGMVQTNRVAFGYHPDDVWPTSAPPIATTADFTTVAEKVNALNTALTDHIEAVTAAYQSHQDEPYVQQAFTHIKPATQELSEFQSSVFPKIAQQMMSAASAANDAYQGFRGVNLRNRQEITNSTSGLIPFMHNRVNAAQMSDSTTEIKAALQEMDRLTQQIAAAAEPFTIKPNRADIPSELSQQPPEEPSQPAAPQAPFSMLPPSQISTAPAAPPADQKPVDNVKDNAAKDNAARDLASLLRGNQPFGGMPMPSMPSLGGGMPGMGGGMPNLGSLGSQLPQSRPPNSLNDELRKALDDKAKPVDDDQPKKPHTETAPAAPPPPTATPAVNHQPAPNPAAAPQPSNSTEIAGKKYNFDNPKLAQLAHNLSGTDGPKGIRQAASDAGFHLPPPGQDIGQPTTADKLKPGDVIMGSGDHNAVYLGDVDGKPMTVTEQGEVKPLSDVAHFDGAHQGFFTLTDDGAAAPTQADSHGATPPTTAATSPQVGQPPHQDTPPLSPRDVTAGN